MFLYWYAYAGLFSGCGFLLLLAFLMLLLAKGERPVPTEAPRGNGVAGEPRGTTGASGGSTGLRERPQGEKEQPRDSRSRWPDLDRQGRREKRTRIGVTHRLRMRTARQRRERESGSSRRKGRFDRIPHYSGWPGRRRARVSGGDASADEGSCPEDITSERRKEEKERK